MPVKRRVTQARRWRGEQDLHPKRREEYVLNTIFDRGLQMVLAATRTQVGYSMRRTMGGLSKMKKRQAAQRQAEIVERTTNKQQTAEAWEAAQAERDAVQAAYVEKVELDCNVISMRCEQSMPREYAHQVSVKLTSIQHTIAQMVRQLAAVETRFSIQLKGLSSAAIEREVHLARLEMEEEMGVVSYHHLTQLQYARVTAKLIFAAMRWLWKTRNSALERQLGSVQADAARWKERADVLEASLMKLHEEFMSTGSPRSSAHASAQQALLILSRERKLMDAETELGTLRQQVADGNKLVSHYRRERIQERAAYRQAMRELEEQRKALGLGPRPGQPNLPASSAPDGDDLPPPLSEGQQSIDGEMQSIDGEMQSVDEGLQSIDGEIQSDDGEGALSRRASQYPPPALEDGSDMSPQVNAANVEDNGEPIAVAAAEGVVRRLRVQLWREVQSRIAAETRAQALERMLSKQRAEQLSDDSDTTESDDNANEQMVSARMHRGSPSYRKAPVLRSSPPRRGRAKSPPSPHRRTPHPPSHLAQRKPVATRSGAARAQATLARSPGVNASSAGRPRDYADPHEDSELGADDGERSRGLRGGVRVHGRPAEGDKSPQVQPADAAEATKAEEPSTVAQECPPMPSQLSWATTVGELSMTDSPAEEETIWKQPCTSVSIRERGKSSGSSVDVGRPSSAKSKQGSVGSPSPSPCSVLTAEQKERLQWLRQARTSRQFAPTKPPDKAYRAIQEQLYQAQHEVASLRLALAEHLACPVVSRIPRSSQLYHKTNDFELVQVIAAAERPSSCAAAMQTQGSDLMFDVLSGKPSLKDCMRVAASQDGQPNPAHGAVIVFRGNPYRLCAVSPGRHFPGAIVDPQTKGLLASAPRTSADVKRALTTAEGNKMVSVGLPSDAKEKESVQRVGRACRDLAAKPVRPFSATTATPSQAASHKGRPGSAQATLTTPPQMVVGVRACIPDSDH